MTHIFQKGLNPRISNDEHDIYDSSYSTDMSDNNSHDQNRNKNDISTLLLVENHPVIQPSHEEPADGTVVTLMGIGHAALSG